MNKKQIIEINENEGEVKIFKEKISEFLKSSQSIKEVDEIAEIN